MKRLICVMLCVMLLSSCEMTEQVEDNPSTTTVSASSEKVTRATTTPTEDDSDELEVVDWYYENIKSQSLIGSLILLMERLIRNEIVGIIEIHSRRSKRRFSCSMRLMRHGKASGFSFKNVRKSVRKQKDFLGKFRNKNTAKRRIKAV